VAAAAAAATAAAASHIPKAEFRRRLFRAALEHREGKHEEAAEGGGVEGCAFWDYCAKNKRLGRSTDGRAKSMGRRHVRAASLAVQRV